MSALQALWPCRDGLTAEGGQAAAGLPLPWTLGLAPAGTWTRKWTGASWNTSEPVEHHMQPRHEKHLALKNPVRDAFHIEKNTSGLTKVADKHVSFTHLPPSVYINMHRQQRRISSHLPKVKTRWVSVPVPLEQPTSPSPPVSVAFQTVFVLS